MVADTPGAEKIAIVRRFQRESRALIHNKDGGPARGHTTNHFEERSVHRRVQAQRHLVDNQQLGPVDECACDRQHLLLPATEAASEFSATTSERRENIENE